MLTYFIKEFKLDGYSYPQWWGNWYVLLPKWHKYYWVDYDDIDVDVHWWLTFWEFVYDTKWFIPEWVEYNEDDYIVWFDTKHYNSDPLIFTEEWVLAETKKLVEQLS